MSEDKQRFSNYNLNSNQLIECPVCGKRFLPAVEHSYRTDGYRGALVCTYSCMRKVQKVKEAKEARRR